VDELLYVALVLRCDAVPMDLLWRLARPCLKTHAFMMVVPRTSSAADHMYV